MTGLRLTIELAGPPRGKGRGRAAVNRATGHAQVFTDSKTVKYESQLRFAAQQRMAGHPPTIQPVRVHVEVVLPIAASWSRKKKRAAALGHIRPDTRGSGDVDNFLKILDALNGIVWADDCQIVEAHVLKVFDNMPSLRIVVETVDPPSLPVRQESLRTEPADLFAGASP